MKTRTSQLTEVGDVSAPKGSRPWAIAIRVELTMALKKADFSSCRAKRMYDALRDTNGWKTLDDGRGNRFMSFEEFCVYRQPFGLGYDKKHIEDIIRERQEKEDADTMREAKPLLQNHRPKKGEDKGADGTLSRGSNQSTYLAARLKRDRPDLAARVVSGELKIRQAAKLAGFIKVKTPLEIIRGQLKKLSEAQMRQLYDEIGSLL